MDQLQWHSDFKRFPVREYRGVSSLSKEMRCRPTEKVQTDPAFRRRRRSRGVFKRPAMGEGLSPIQSVRPGGWPYQPIKGGRCVMTM